MIKYILTKISKPGWEQDFYDKQRLQQKLYQHICEQCRCEEGITPISDIADMLATACGCEFMLEDNNE
jgi:hypothetical protein